MTQEIEKEIRQLANRTDLLEALKILNIIPSHCRDVSIDESRPWYRSGAETYSLIFKINNKDLSLQLIIKACVAYSPSKNAVDKILEKWIKRRMLLAKNAIVTPKLYGWGNGILLEEYVPFGLEEVLPNNKNREKIFLEIGRILGIVARLDFAPVALIDDMRIRLNGDIVMIDFGEDLGDPCIQPGRRLKMFEIFEQWRDKANVDVDEKEVDIARSGFMKHVVNTWQ